jgi:hypothetical protein
LNDLPITSVSIARPVAFQNGTSGSPEIDTSTLQILTFSGSKNVTIPNGAHVLSDPINFNIASGSDLTITIYLEEGQPSNFITSHPGSRTNSYFSFGNYVEAQNMTDPSTQFLAHW